MPAFFSNQRGTVVRVGTSGRNDTLPFRIVVLGSDLGQPWTQAIVTQAGVIESGNYQFMHTLSETIYAYIFGDRIGELRVSGVCFAYNCLGAPNGVRQIADTYRRLRIANAGAPVMVSIGGVDYQGFLIGMTLDIANAEQNLGQWTMRFNTFPGNQ